MQREVMEIQRVLQDNPLLYQVMKIASETEVSKIQQIALRLSKGELKGMRTDHIQIFQCFRESVLFLLHSRKAMELILLNAAVGAAATLLRFFLQARLTENGLPDAMLGPALFYMGLGGAAGARLILHCKSWSYGRVFAVSAIAVAGCVAAALLPVPAVMVFGGFLSALFDNFLQVRSDVRLNEMVPAGQRATLISVSSLCFSVVMIVLSPLFGLLFS